MEKHEIQKGRDANKLKIDNLDAAKIVNRPSEKWLRPAGAGREQERKLWKRERFSAPVHVSIVQPSRVSAAALSTVLRTTTLSYGNMRFSGIRPAETPKPIKMKFCTIDYVGEFTRCAKTGWNRLAGGGPTDR